jgi:uncharacterized protein YcfJ
MFASMTNVVMAESIKGRVPVVSAEPVFSTVSTPVRKCFSEQLYNDDTTNNPSMTGQIIGGIVGGLLGNSVGKGNGKKLAIATGATAGTIIGGNYNTNSTNNSNQYREVERCKTEYIEETVIKGYNVTYEINGYQFTQFSKRKPGQMVNVVMQVNMVE